MKEKWLAYSFVKQIEVFSPFKFVFWCMFNKLMLWLDSQFLLIWNIWIYVISSSPLNRIPSFKKKIQKKLAVRAVRLLRLREFQATAEMPSWVACWRGILLLQAKRECSGNYREWLLAISSRCSATDQENAIYGKTGFHMSSPVQGNKSSSVRGHF